MSRIQPSDLVLRTQMRYEVHLKPNLHLQGGRGEVEIVLLFDVEDPQGGKHVLNLRLSEADFGRFVADVGLDVFKLKRQLDPEAKPQQFPEASES